MSTATMVSAMKVPGLSALEKLLLVFLGDKENVNEDNTSRWSIPAIAWYLDFSERAIKKSLHSLAEKNLIKIEARPRKPNRYSVTIDPSFLARDRRHPENTAPSMGEQNVPLTPFEGEQNAPLKGEQNDPPGVNKTTVMGEQNVHSGVNERVPESPIESLKGIPQRTYPAREPPLASIKDPEGWKEFWDACPPSLGAPGNARLAYAQALAEGATPTQLLHAMRIYASHIRPHTPLDAVKRPVTWLRERGWEAKMGDVPKAASLLDAVMAKLDEQLAGEAA